MKTVTSLVLVSIAAGLLLASCASSVEPPAGAEQSADTAKIDVTQKPDAATCKALTLPTADACKGIPRGKPGPLNPWDTTPKKDPATCPKPADGTPACMTDACKGKDVYIFGTGRENIDDYKGCPGFVVLNTDPYSWNKENMCFLRAAYASGCYRFLSDGTNLPKPPIPVDTTFRPAASYEYLALLCAGADPKCLSSGVRRKKAGKWLALSNSCSPCTASTAVVSAMLTGDASADASVPDSSPPDASADTSPPPDASSCGECSVECACGDTDPMCVPM